MKKAYQKPTLAAQLFAANEYVAACGDHGTNYLFECNAGDGRPGIVWLETNGQPGLQKGNRHEEGDQSLGGYTACGKKHEASSQSDFKAGYYVSLFGSDTPVNVIVWRGENNNNVHCTTNLDMNNWETAKS